MPSFFQHKQAIWQKVLKTSYFNNKQIAEIFYEPTSGKATKDGDLTHVNNSPQIKLVYPLSWNITPDT